MDKGIDLQRERKRRICAYFRMWVTRDFARFDDIFAQNCRYEECTGAVYEGLGELHQWIDVMLARQQVSEWAIHEFIHAEGDYIIVVWTFEYCLHRTSVAVNRIEVFAVGWIESRTQILPGNRIVCGKQALR